MYVAVYIWSLSGPSGQAWEGRPMIVHGRWLVRFWGVVGGVLTINCLYRVSHVRILIIWHLLRYFILFADLGWPTSYTADIAGSDRWSFDTDISSSCVRS